MKLNHYSVVIAVDRPDKPIAALSALSALPRAEQPREVFLSCGRNPSMQRNEGVRLCRSPLIYFLDDDSRVLTETPNSLMSHFSDPRTAVAGGPNLVPPEASAFERAVSAVLASWLGSFKVRNRYAALGSVKEATEKDLILCNLMVRREAFIREGGFRVDLYPNEENEFLNRLMHHEHRLVYDPHATIYRPRRKNLLEFCRQSFRYGRGRGRQIRVYPCLSDLVHFVPGFFLLYVLSLLPPLFASPNGSQILKVLSSLEWRAPGFLFLALAFGTAISAISWHRNYLDLLSVPLLLFLRHFFYGIGLFAGLFSPIPTPDRSAPRLYRVTWRGSKMRCSPVPSPKADR